ncbi:hypothetical protein MMC30_009285 [Trapelia coarctata]|nr:hypothetical protein [Trapelia coarctata]
MATSQSSGAPFDPTKSGKYPIIVSERLLNGDDGSDFTYASIQLNHQPSLTSPVQSTITPFQSDPSSLNLTVNASSPSSKHTYTGSQQASTACALIFDPATQSFTLDRIDTELSFNLRSTPANKSAKALAAQYPQLETTAPDPVSDEEDLFADEAALADPDNPYDYRHYLKRRQSSSPEPIDLVSRDASRNASRDPSPLPQVPRAKPKPKANPKPKPRSPRQQTKRAPSPPPREEADADNEDSDDGGLQIIMDGASYRPRRFHTTFSRGDEAPISLRSAASSVSPAVMAQESSEESSDEDEIRLPSPAQDGEASVRGPQIAQEDDDDDGGLEAELERELGRTLEEDDQEGGGVALPQYVAESSSESEEE